MIALIYLAAALEGLPYAYAGETAKALQCSENPLLIPGLSLGNISELADQACLEALNHPQSETDIKTLAKKDLDKTLERLSDRECLDQAVLGYLAGLVQSGQMLKDFLKDKSWDDLYALLGNVTQKTWELMTSPEHLARTAIAIRERLSGLQTEITRQFSEQSRAYDCLPEITRQKLLCRALGTFAISGALSVSPLGKPSLTKVAVKEVKIAEAAALPKTEAIAREAIARDTITEIKTATKTSPAAIAETQEVAKGLAKLEKRKAKLLDQISKRQMPVDRSALNRFSGPLATREISQQAYIKLHDPKAFAEYTEKLIGESIERTQKIGDKAALENLKQGKVSEEAFYQILLERFKARGFEKFKVLTKETSELINNSAKATPEEKAAFERIFAEHIREPMVDEGMYKTSHSQFAHLVQLDYIYETLERATKGNVREYLNYLADENGLGTWNRLFDTFEGGSALNEPEVLKDLYGPLGLH